MDPLEEIKEAPAAQENLDAHESEVLEDDSGQS